LAPPGPQLASQPDEMTLGRSIYPSRVYKLTFFKKRFEECSQISELLQVFDTGAIRSREQKEEDSVNKSKKLTAAVAASAVASAVVAPAAFAATTFTDINDSYAKAAIEELVAAGILNGKGDGKFDPSGKIERQDFAIILAKALDLKVEAPATATFKDVPKDHYSFGYVEAAAKAKLISGMGDGTFGAGKELTRQDMAVLFVRALSYATGYNAEGKASKLAFKDNDAIATYAKDAVGAAVELGLVSGNPDGTFNPAGNAQRQAVALVASKFLKVADKATITEATFVDKNTVTVKFDKAVDLKKEDIAVAVKATKAAVEVKEVVAAADKKSATVKVADLAAGTTYTLTFNGKTVELSTPAVALAITKAKSVSNTKVEVTLAAAVTSVDASAFTVKNAAGTAVEVKGATLSADGKSVIVETASLTAYAAYSVTANSVTKTFVGLPADTTKPVVATATPVENNKVRVDFSERVDVASATNVANYTVDNNLTVLKAELSADGMYVTLTTSPQTVGTIYKVNVKNVADMSANLVDATDKFFGGVPADTQAQAVSTLAVTDYNQVKVEFADTVDAATATNIANYTIDNSLSVLKAEVAIDGKTVYLTTSDQVVGTIYKVTINNVKDEAGNNMAEAATKYFGGVPKDTVVPSVTSVTAADNTKLEVLFDKKVDAATATDIANYTVDNNLVVVAAELSTDGKLVTLTTAPQTVGQIYKVNIKNVKTALSAAMTAVDKFFGGVPKDVAGPAISTVEAKGNGVIEITFSEKVSEDSATTLTNYVFDNGLGYATNAVLDAAGTKVTLTGAPQVPAKIYNVTVSNVLDINGNAIAATNNANVRSFVGKGTTSTATVKYQTASVVNNNTLDLLFDTDMTDAAIAGLTVSVTKPDGTALTGVVQKAWITDNKKIVRVQFAVTGQEAVNNAIFTVPASGSNVYKATVAGVTNLDAVSATNTNTHQFAGTTVVNAVPEIQAVIPVDKNTLKVLFSEKVTGVTNASFTFDSGLTIRSLNVQPTDKVSEVLVYLNEELTTANGKIYVLTPGTFNDAAGYVAGKTVDAAGAALAVKFAGTNVENAAPKITAVVPVDEFNFDIVFSEAVVEAEAEAATYSVTYTQNNAPQTLDIAAATKTLSADGQKLRVNLTAANKLKAGNVYKLETSSVITDRSGKAMDVTATSTTNEAQFAGTNVANALPEIAGVSYDATGNTLTVIFAEEVATTGVAADFDIMLGTTAVTGTSYTLGADNKTVTINFGAPLASGIYSVKAKSTVTDVNGQAAKDAAVQFGVN